MPKLCPGSNQRVHNPSPGSGYVGCSRCDVRLAIEYECYTARDAEATVYAKAHSADICLGSGLPIVLSSDRMDFHCSECNAEVDVKLMTSTAVPHRDLRPPTLSDNPWIANDL